MRYALLFVFLFSTQSLLAADDSRTDTPFNAIVSESLSFNDRRLMVVSAFKMFPTVIHFVVQLEEFQFLPPNQRRVLTEVSQLAQRLDTQLIFATSDDGFIIRPGEPERMMRASSVVGDPTFVNSRQALDPDFELDLPAILKLIAHEFGHRTTETSWAVRDRAFQFLERALSPHHKVRTVSDKRGDWQVESLSLPSVKVQSHYGTKSGKSEDPFDQELLPTFVVLVSKNGFFQDVTTLIAESLRPSKSMLRSIWAEVNRASLMIFNQLFQFIESAMLPAIQALAELMTDQGMPLPSELMQFKSQFAQEGGLIEVQLFDIVSIDTVRLSNDKLFLKLNGRYVITRNLRKYLTINADGFQWNDEHPVMVTVRAILPTPDLTDDYTDEHPETFKPSHFQMVLRPKQFSPMDVARVEQVTRHRDEVSAIEVSFPASVLSSRQSVSSILLELQFEGGHLHTPAVEVRPIQGSNRLVARFEMAKYQRSSRWPLFAVGLLIDGLSAMELDRLVEWGNGVVDDNKGINQSLALSDNTLVPNSVGLWGQQNGKKLFRNSFQYNAPILFLNSVNSPDFSVNPSKMVLEFELAQEEKVREVRLHFHQFLTLIRTKPESQIFEYETEGESYKLTTGGPIIRQDNLHEIVVVGMDQIYHAETTEGRFKVRAEFSMPFRMLKQRLDRDEAHGPPYMNLILVEVVTANNRTLVYNFESSKPPTTPSDCDKLFDL